MFLQAGGTIAVAAVLPEFTGCSPAQVVLDVEGVLKEAASITAAAGQTTWSNDFTTAANALQAAYNVWDQSTTSTTGQKIAALLNALVAATAIILPTDPFASLINELVALADLALSFWPGNAQSVVAPSLSPRVTLMNPANPHVGAATPPKSYKDALARWNALAVGPLAKAQIK
jgi:hypothetical protein